MPEIGQLRHRITIQSKSGGDDWGDDPESWADVATISAEIVPLQGGELVEAQQVDDRVTHRITIRHYVGLTTRHRLIHHTSIYHISGIVNVDMLGEWDIITAIDMGETL